MNKKAFSMFVLLATVSSLSYNVAVSSPSPSGSVMQNATPEQKEAAVHELLDTILNVPDAQKVVDAANTAANNASQGVADACGLGDGPVIVAQVDETDVQHTADFDNEFYANVVEEGSYYDSLY